MEFWKGNVVVASALSVIPEAYHAGILAGNSTVDVAPYLNSGLNSYGILELPQSGQMSIGSSLFVPSGGGLLGVNFGCTIKALPAFGNWPMIRNANPYPTTDGGRDRNLIFQGIRLDGNRTANTSATEFSHGIQLYAVDGVKLDVWVVNPKGDGVSIQQAYEAKTVGCSYITGKVRTSGCRRQGVTITCGEQVDLDVYDTGGDLTSVDIEPDNSLNFVRNVFIRLLSIGAGNGTDVSGGIAISGDGSGSVPTNITVDFQIFNAGGHGVLWREVKGLVLRGCIENAAGNGLVGLDAGVVPSRVLFDGVRVYSPGANGLVSREVQGSIYDGSVTVEEAGGMGVYIANARGGTLGLTVKNSGQQGITLSNTRDMTFPSPISLGNNSHNVWLGNSSSGNRFQFLHSAGSNWGWGFLEDQGCNDNRAFFSRVSGNSAGNVSTRGAQSLVELGG
jgi:hypothetical protein